MPAFPPEIQPLVDRLLRLRAAGRVQVALLYGSYAKGTVHARSDIDLALALAPANAAAELSLVDELLMSVDREVSILRLDDPDESPWVIQAALKGMHLVEPDWAAYYAAADRALHETESLRLHRGMTDV